MMNVMHREKIEVVAGTSEDLVQVLGWLQHEYEEDGDRVWFQREYEECFEGFWCHRDMIAKAQETGDFWVIRRGGVSVAFQVGNYGAVILNVRKDWQGKGLGSAHFEASLLRAQNDNVNVLFIECAPRSSWTFWQRHGFERYGNMGDEGKLTARRVLHRSFDLSSDLVEARVVIGFYPENANDDNSDLWPIANHEVRGVRLANGVIALEHRVIGCADDEAKGSDMVVKIKVDGTPLYFDKAKYPEAADMGVQRDWNQYVYYIDKIVPCCPVSAG